MTDSVGGLPPEVSPCYMKGMSAALSSPRTFRLQEPERFLRHLAAHRDEVDLSQVSLCEMWALGAMAALGRRRGKAPLRLTGGTSPARVFARAVGFDDVVDEKASSDHGEAGRTVRLTEVFREEDIHPVAREIARLLAANEPEPQSSRWAMQYVIVELLRNVVQHSDDPLGGVVGAQRNDRGLHDGQPAFQVVVADNGKGILASLSRLHPELESDDVALERALWPHFSGAFPYGRSGGEENAGLGLFYISELAKDLGGRLLVSSGTASMLVDPSLPERQHLLGVGYPGTLVAFEVPVNPARDFDTLFQDIGKHAADRTPRRLVKEWLRFESAPSVPTFAVALFLEDNHKARALATTELIPRIVKSEPVALDFTNVRVCTQSFAHALLYEALRFAWASQTPVYILNATPVVRSALEQVQLYSQGG